MPTKTHAFTTRQHMINRTYEVYHYWDRNMSELALHHHDFYEMYLFLSGDISYNIESRIYHVHPGDILLISPNELHQPLFGSDSEPYERIVVWVDKGYLRQTSSFGLSLAQCFDQAAERHANLLRPDDATLQTLRVLLDRIMVETDSDRFGAQLFADACLFQMLVMLNRLAERNVQHPEIRDKSGSVVAQVLAYINEHYSEELSLDLLANKFFISKYHLSREFNRLVGTSVYRFIIQKRLVMAKQMLGEGMPSSEVYQQCGFGDYSNFYRAFKAEYQISPKEYAARVKMDADDLTARAKERGMVLVPSQGE